MKTCFEDVTEIPKKILSSQSSVECRQRVMKLFAVFVIFHVSLALNNLSFTGQNRDQSFACGVPHQSFGLVVGGEAIIAGDFPW